MGGEPLYCGNAWIGYVRAAAFGYSLGGGVGLAMVENANGVTKDWLKAGDFTAQMPDGRTEVRLSLQPLFDPKRERILA